MHAGNRLWHVLAATVVLGLLATSAAIGQEGGGNHGPTATAASGEGRSIVAGRRNPSGGRDLSRETQIIANTKVDTYGTRQSNKGKGGGAIYGCRAALDANNPADPERTTPCIRANNLHTGQAFQFNSIGGSIVGAITVGSSFRPNANAKPFITNATGVATGLNADQVDGRGADEIVGAARQKQGLQAERADTAAMAADADKLDGKDATDFVAAGTVQTAGVKTLGEGESATLFTRGPLTITARCAASGADTAAQVVATTSEANSVAGGDENTDADLDPGEEVVFEQTDQQDAPGGTPTASDGADDQWYAFATSGAALTGSTPSWADADSGQCRFFGTATVAG